MESILQIIEMNNGRNSSITNLIVTFKKEVKNLIKEIDMEIKNKNIKVIKKKVHSLKGLFGEENVKTLLAKIKVENNIQKIRILFNEAKPLIKDLLHCFDE